MFRYRFLILVFLPVLLLAALLIGVTSTAQAQTTILYVDRNAGGSNNGSSWADAFTSLQGALTVANTNPANSYEVWVAKGAYTPGIARTDTFSLTHNNVQLYGGFAGTESQREDRNWGGNLTILSGDIDNNDAADANGIVANTANITGSNSYHVLWLDGVNNGPITGKTVIDGFFITAGQANGAPPDSSGGGIFCAGNGSGSECSPTLTNLIVIGNAAATGGGGIFNYGADGGISSPTLTGATIRNNSATAGGGLLNSGDNGGRSNPLLTQVFFVNNTAVAGGGIYNAGRLTDSVSSPILNNVTFQGNVASSNNGGGMYNNGLGGGQSSPSLTNVTFTGNSANAGSGGGMYNLGNSGVSNPSLLNVTFTSNTAVNGGGISNNGVVGGQSSPSLSNVTFTSNSATTAGGGMFSVGNGGASNPTLRNVRFVTNVATTVGGGLYSNSVNGGESNSTLIAVTFLGNSAANGGGMANVSTTGGNTSPSLTNVLVSGNLASALGGGVLNAATAPGVVNPSLINATFSGNRAGNGAGMANIGSNPTIRNAIVWNNRQGNDVSSILNDSATPNVAHSLVEGCNPSGAWTGACGADGGNNLSDADPRFQTPVDPATAPTDAGTLRLEADSPAINVGNNAALPVGVTTDLDGNPRISNGTVDLGVYETLTASPLYVSQGATGANNGSSWADAFTYVQSALKVANNYPNTSYEIWVATGVYTPGSARDDSFLLRHNNVQLYGGFATTETLRTQRDWVANPTVLSGDNDSNDGVDANGVVTNTAVITGSNSYHVLWLDGVNHAPITGTTVIDGFTITAGKADGDNDLTGGGLYCAGSGSGNECSPTLRNVTFSGNQAYGGGGMYNNGRDGNSSPTLSNVAFRGNSSIYDGGGMYNYGQSGVSSPVLTNVTFSGNQVGTSGGGMYNYGADNGVSSPILADVTFSDNSAKGGSGGGMYNTGANNGVSNPVLTDVTFSGNLAAGYGGGISNVGTGGESSPILTNVIIRGNKALDGGGGIYNGGDLTNGKSSPTLINVIISGNRAESTGGGMYNDGRYGGNSSPTLINVTVSGNYSFYQGGAMRNDGRFGGSSHPVIRNSIIVDNTALPATSIHNDDATATISYSLTDECNPGGIWLNDCGIDGGNNLSDVAALFITPLHPATAPNSGGDLRLAAGSPAINAGDNGAINATGVTTDLAGNARIQSGVVDMGAYEFDLPDCPTASPLYVHAGAGGSNSGDSWSNALTNLQNGLVLAQRCAAINEVWVATGVYTPGTAQTTSFRVPPGVAIYGGFAATETLRTQRDWVANVTVLSGDIESNDGVDANGVVTHTANITGSNSYHVLWLDGVNYAPITGTTVIDGFTITGGKADGPFAPHGQGGGLYCAGSGGGKQCSPSLANLTFIGNAALFGAGMFNNGSNGGVSSPSLINSIFRGNQATSNGGGIYNNGNNGVSSPSLTGTTFSGNSANFGGGMYNYGGAGVSSPSLTGVTFSGNHAAASGGGMSNYGVNGVSSPGLTGVSFSGNQAASSGGGIYNNGDNGMSSPNLTDVTFSGNSARFGGGMYNNGRNGGVSSPSLVNSLFRGNQAGSSGGGLYNDGSNGVSSPSLTGVAFSGNSATAFGGGMYNYGSTGVSSPSLTGVTFSGNQAGSSGGGLYNYGVNGVSSPSLTNSIFSGNSAINSGGGMFNNGNTGVSNPVLINITFSGNHAGNAGGMANLSSNPTISNTIFWNNRKDSGVSSMVNDAGIPTIAYSLIEGCNPGGVWASACGADGGNNLLDADPLFVTPIDATTAPTTTGNLRLQAGSPAIDAGNNAALPAGVTSDLDGNPRIVNNTVDMGAYEASFTDTPIAGLSATSDSPTLLGQSTLFTATVNAGSNITYTWDFGDGAGTGSGATASYTFTATGTYTATVTASNGAGSQPAQTVVTVFALEPIYLPVVRR